jgi:hypothetical protein
MRTRIVNRATDAPPFDLNVATFDVALVAKPVSQTHFRRRD